MSLLIVMMVMMTMMMMMMMMMMMLAAAAAADAHLYSAVTPCIAMHACSVPRKMEK